MNSITKQIRTETAHRLLDYDGRCAHLHGHSYLWEVTASAETLDDRGMVADFKVLKAAMNTVLDPLDHALVLHHDDPILPVLSQDRRNDWFRATNGENPRLHLMPWNPTAENFARWAAHKIQQELDLTHGALVEVTRVRVWETSTSFADWER